MVKNVELPLDFNSRYKRTKLFTKDGRVFFGRWRPLDVQIDGDEEEIEVQEGEEGQLRIFANNIYGTPDLEHVIAQANKLFFIPEQVVPGQRLIIPKQAHVDAALQKTVTRQGEERL